MHQLNYLPCRDLAAGGERCGQHDRLPRPTESLGITMRTGSSDVSGNCGTRGGVLLTFTIASNISEVAGYPALRRELRR